MDEITPREFIKMLLDNSLTWHIEKDYEKEQTLDNLEYLLNKLLGK